MFSSFVAFSQDNEPPIITSPARDTTFQCGSTQNLINLLTTWYNIAGNALAEDDSGDYDFEANLSLNETISVFLASSDTLCGNTQSVRVTFTAVDPSGNRSLPTSASFSTIDTQRPGLIVPPNVSYFCTLNIRDTLIQWIRNKGGYQATDLCSSTFNWTRFQYSIRTNNIVIQSGGGSISQGPYPNIPNGICNWQMNINFWVYDECGNETVTFGTTTFSVIDNVAPTLSQTPPDVTVNCDMIPQIPTITALDGCTQNVIVSFNETSTQDSLTTVCAHYQYTLKRTWTAEDNCNNQISHVQTITVQDTTKPSFSGLSKLNIGCSIFNTNPDSLFIIVQDNCSPVSVQMTQNIPPISCLYNVARRYTLTDVCNNQTIFEQTIEVSSDPINIEKPAVDQIYLCEDIQDYNSLFSIWVNDFGGSKIQSSCSAVQRFAAVPGSYQNDDPTTFPGIHPNNFDAQSCPSNIAGYLRGEVVDFVYFDTCGQILVTSAIFGIRDTIKPMVAECNKSLTIYTTPDNCEGSIMIDIPNVSDNCTEESSPVVRMLSTPLTSQNPGNVESIVDPVTLKIGPFNPASVIPLSDGQIELLFRNMDIDDVTEYFNIYDENNNFLGRSPNSVIQCGSASMTIVLPQNKMAEWLSDGFIDLHFIPNIVADIPIASINDFCTGSRIETTLTFDIEVNNVITKTYSIGNGPLINIGDETQINLTFPEGNHKVNLFFTDCAQNTTQCSINTQVIDQTAPLLQCPQNIQTVLDLGVCEKEVTMPIMVNVFESCSGNRVYDQVAPLTAEAALVTFLYNENIGRHLARNKQLVFNNVFPIDYVFIDPILEVEFYGDNNNIGEYFDIIGPDGSLIGSTTLSYSTAECNMAITNFSIPFATFNNWIFNNQINFTAIPNNNANVDGNGINPCISLMPNQTTDGISFLKARLKYSDAAFSYQLSGATTSTSIDIPLGNKTFTTKLNAGTNNITLITGDNSGNKGTCIFQVEVIDEEKPTAICKNASVNIHPSGIDDYLISTNLINNASFDNCPSSLKLSTIPDKLDCSMAGTDVNVLLVAMDDFGNKDTCTAIIRVKAYELAPTFSSGLCQNDTLKLFANVPFTSVPNTYSFHWRGPNGIEFFVENPEIPNINPSFNGVYTLKVTGFNQCVSEGSVIVNIQPLTNPSLTSTTNTLCEGESVILNTTNFTGNINYEWYEGIAPTGIRIATTSTPTLVIKPEVGVHFYYTIATGPDCSSNASQLLKITVLKKPIASVNQLFLNICEGENIILGTAVSGSGFSYSWTGPSGYSEMGQNPRIVQNATIQNQGNYKLVISNSGCLSDTVSTQVVILERPQKPIINSATVFCEGATFNLLVTNVNNADKYEWFLNGVLRFTTLDNNLTITNVQVSFQGNWQVIAYKGNCPSVISNIQVIAIDNLIEIGATNSGPVCQGDSVRLQATFLPNATYKWEGPNPNISIPSTHNPTIIGLPGSYSVTITTPTLCQNSASTTVVVISPAVITALSNSSSPCMDGETTITFSPSIFPQNQNYTYLWTSTNSMFTSNVLNPVIPNAVIQDTGIYTLIVFNQGCPSLPASTIVRFSMIPPKPTILIKEFYCQGDSIILEVGQNSLFLNETYIWNTPLGQMTTLVPKLIIPMSGMQHEGFYTVEVINGDCRSEVSSKVEIKIRSKPQTPVIINNSPYCFGSTISLNSNYMDNVDFFWTGPENFESTEAMPSIINAREINQGFYRLQITQNGCSSEVSQPVFIEILPKLSTPRIIDGSFNLCKTAFSFVEICIDPNSVLPGDSIVLFNANTNIEIARSNNLCFVLSNQIEWMDGDNFIYAVVLKNNCKSDRSNFIIINVTSPPNIQPATTEGNEFYLCEGEFKTLESLFGPPDVNISWYSNDNDVIFANLTNNEVTVAGLKPGINTILLSYSAGGCINFVTDTIRINVEGIPKANNDDYSIEYGAELLLDFLKNDILPPNYTLTFESEPKYGTIEQRGQDFIYIPDLRYVEDISLIYKICSNQCPGFCTEAIVTISFNQNIDCKAPTIFTPNEDGINDHFILACLNTNAYPNNKIVIFNEWGSEVLSASPYLNDWAGTYGGDLLPVGTYFYVIDLGDGQKPINGFLILQR